MSDIRALTALVSSFAAFSACGDSFGPPERGGEAIQTDGVRYDATPTGDAAPGFVDYELTVVATFTNPTDDTLYLDRCRPDSPGPIYGVDLIEPEDPDGAAYDADWACVGHDRQFAVAPGESRVDTLRISGPNAWQGGSYIGRLEGLFRLRYSVWMCADCGESAPDDLEFSNVFEIRIDG